MLCGNASRAIVLLALLTMVKPFLASYLCLTAAAAALVLLSFRLLIIIWVEPIQMNQRVHFLAYIGTKLKIEVLFPLD